MRKTESYKMFGFDVLLSERNASDIFALEKYINDNKSKHKDTYFNMEITYKKIIDSLSYYVKSQWLVKRMHLRRKFNVVYMLNNLGFNETKEILDIIDRLEGNDKKKVKAEKKSHVKISKD